MPENHIPAAQPEAGASPEEFNFTKPVAENPRIRRRSLKAKPEGLIKAAAAPPAARELEREAPPLSAEEAAKPRVTEPVRPKVEPPARVTEALIAPRAAASPAAAKAPVQPASSLRAAAAASAPSPKIASTVTPASSAAASPHGTRPATLYYSSQPRKDTEVPSPMKTIPTASPAPASTGATPSSPVTRPATSSATEAALSPAARPTTASPRPTTTTDYRANVERQSREQKSVGNILSYIVYGLIFLFVVGGALAAYGANVIFAKIHDQSQTVSDLDQKYAAANRDLNAKLATTQDSLTQALAQIARQQDLIVREQEDINRLIAASNDSAAALKLEKQARLQETQSRLQEAANLRGRVRELEYKASAQSQKF